MSAFRHVALPLLLAVTLVGGCGKKFSDDSKVLASVDGENITEQDYENYLQLRQGQQSAVADKDKERKVVLDEMIDRVLLAHYGAKLGLEQTPDVYFRLKRMRENVLAQEVVRNAAKETPITDDDVKKRFEQEIGNMNKTEYKTRHILVKTEDEAKQVATRLRAGMGFDQLAKTRSQDGDSNKRGGELGWIGQGTSWGQVPEFFNATAALKNGETSAPVKSEFGWHIIRVEDTRPLKLPTYEEFVADPRAPASLKRTIQQERVQAMLKDLRDKAKVTIK